MRSIDFTLIDDQLRPPISALVTYRHDERSNEGRAIGFLRPAWPMDSQASEPADAYTRMRQYQNAFLLSVFL
jgi:hypothetical protein